MSGVRIPHSKKWSQEHKNARFDAKFLCKGCGEQHRDTDFHRMRFARKVVDCAVSLYHKGLPLKAVKQTIFEIFELVVSTTSIWKWCQKFAKQAQEIIQGLGERLHCDETLIKTRRRFPIGYMPKAIRTDSMPAYRFAISSVFRHEVRHEKVISFKHGNNVIENFFRCKRRFPKFWNHQSAKRFIGHWVSSYNEEKGQISETFIIRCEKCRI